MRNEKTKSLFRPIHITVANSKLIHPCVFLFRTQQKKKVETAVVGKYAPGSSLFDLYFTEIQFYSVKRYNLL